MTIRNPTYDIGKTIRDHEGRISRLEKMVGLYDRGEALRMVGTAAYEAGDPEPPEDCGSCLRCREIDHDDATMLMAELVLLSGEERRHIEDSVRACGVCGFDDHVVSLCHSTPDTEACDQWEA